MSNYFEIVQGYVLDLNLNILNTHPDEELLIVEDVERGIQNLIIDCEDPILVLEQVVLQTPADPRDLFERLLKMNGDLIHGAYMLSEDGKLVLWRDTLQLANLDANEIEGSISALSLAMAEHASILLNYAKA
jgi:hypothetical protein